MRKASSTRRWPIPPGGPYLPDLPYITTYPCLLIARACILPTANEILLKPRVHMILHVARLLVESKPLCQDEPNKSSFSLTCLFCICLSKPISNAPASHRLSTPSRVPAPDEASALSDGGDLFLSKPTRFSYKRRGRSAVARIPA